MNGIHIEAGALTTAELLPQRPERRRVAVLAQPTVVGLAESVASRLREAGLEVSVRSLPDGEAAKTLEVAGDVYHWLNALGLNRFDTLLAIGGGAATDLGGFVGATYLRGVETIYCPTTLLGAVDAAVGGKTGVNVDGKNLVGVFAQPARVVIDLDVLSPLPANLLREGFAEALKAGLVGDVELVELFETHGMEAPLEDVVRKAVTVKQGIVADDFREEGRRMILNYGHTVGHGVEMAGGLAHGEAVAIGMVAAGAIAEAVVGFAGADRQRAVISQLGLAVAVPVGVGRAEIEEFIGLDKKRDEKGLRMVLLEDVGRPVVVHVTDEALAAGLAAIGVA